MKDKINAARKKAIVWFESMSMEMEDTVVYCNSSYNLQHKLEDMYFPGTYNAYHCLYLLGEPIKWKEGLKRYFDKHQLENGVFRMRSMKLEDLYYPSFEYDDLHITNYTLGIMDSLEIPLKYPLSFIEEYGSIKKLDRWLGKRDLGNPWVEGNNFVNLASFYIYCWEQGSDRQKKRWRKLLQRLVDWHYYNQDSTTGYWLDPKKADLISAMAGATHNFHIFYYLGLPLPHYEKIVDHCLTILHGVTSACLDIDVVDILTNLIHYGYRVEEITAYLEKKLNDLLESQNADGGFYDVTTGTRVFDGWSVYKEPQGISNCFATWFRMATIGMISVTLYPETADQWHFRKNIGIGHYSSANDNLNRDKPLIKVKKDIKPSKLWFKKRSRTIDLSDDNGVSLEDITVLTLKSFNEKGLSIFDKPTVFGFRVKEEGKFYIRIDQCQANVLDGREYPSDIMITVSIKNLTKMLQGKLMPAMAYGMKKLAIEGDITLALKLQNLF